jgi:hypothetical protein
MTKRRGIDFSFGEGGRILPEDPAQFTELIFATFRPMLRFAFARR